MSEILNSRYYPTLASIVDTEDIPDVLGFVKDGIITVLGKLHYKDLQYSKSPKGDAAFYSVSIVTKKRLDFQIPGTQIYFVLNPDMGDNPDFKVSVFPITLNYEWKILAYIRDFSLIDFTESPQEIFELAMRVLNISQEQVIAQFINIFTEPLDTDITPLQQYVNDINADPDLGATITDPTDETTLRQVNEDIYDQTGDLSSYAGFKVYINVDGDLDETKARLKRFFRALLPNDIEAYVKDLLLPKIRTTLTLSAGLEFPRNLLKPVYDVDGNNPFDETDTGNEAFSVIPGDGDDNPKVMLEFGEVEFYADTQRGFGYNMDLALTTNVPAQIGNTSLVIDIENVKIDLLENSNIPEADADGRPNSFKGVYVGEATIAFPNFFNPSADNTAIIIARNLLIGSQGGISGTIGIDTNGDSLEYLNFIPTVERNPETNEITGYSGFNFNAGIRELTISGVKKGLNDLDEPTDVIIEDFKVYIPSSGITLIDAENQYFDIAADGTVTGIDSPLLEGLFNFDLFGAEIVIKDFYVTFSKSKVVSSTVTGTIKIDQLDEPLLMEIDFTNGFSVKVSYPSPPGINVLDTNIITLNLRELELGRVDEKIFIALKAKITNNLEIPYVDKFVPKIIDAQNLKWTQGEGFDYKLVLEWANGLKLGLSNDDDGGPTIEPAKIRIPFNQKKDDGLFKLDAIDLSIKPETDGVTTGVELVGATLNMKKIVVLTVDGLGAEVELVKNDIDGNVGPFDVAFGLIPPKGIGIKVDAKAITGGGYVFLDFEKGRYVGAAELTIKDKVSLKVIGIITTRLPNGEKGNSVLLLVTAEFSPINIGFGFTLNGVGGLVAINRDMNLQALRDGVKSNAIDNIMFPDDPVGNISQIVSDLESIFPIQKGRYSFGVMGLIGWGTPTLVTIELGLMLSVPKPVRLAVLGVVKCILPDEKNDLLRLQINFLGTIDFEAKYITFDASIYDSKFIKFTLAGDMAFRLKWGDEPNFLFSVGGFHPSYTPPPLNLPTMQRLTINFLAEDNPRLTLSTYIAVTSNTVQFGALLDFYYRITKNIEVIGALGFDILIQFSPFYLKAELYAMLAVLRKKKALFSVSLYGMLEGPAPWHVQGKAEFTVLKLKCKANFDKTFGEEEDTVLPDINVLERLEIAALEKGNWEGILPVRSNLSVSLREHGEEVDGLLLTHPNGSLAFSQKIVPLQTTINKFGKQNPVGHKWFDLAITDMAETEFTAASTKEFFAPAEFIFLSDNEKLRRKSFEKMKSGVRVSESDVYESAAFQVRPLEYERVVYDSIDEEAPGEQISKLAEKSIYFQSFVGNNAASKSSLGTRKKPNSNFSPNKVKVSDEVFKIANLDSLTEYVAVDVPDSFGSEAEANVALERLFTTNPALIDQLDVVLEHELI